MESEARLWLLLWRGEAGQLDPGNYGMAAMDDAGPRSAGCGVGVAKSLWRGGIVLVWMFWDALHACVFWASDVWVRGCLKWSARDLSGL